MLLVDLVSRLELSMAYPLRTTDFFCSFHNLVDSLYVESFAATAVAADRGKGIAS